jgi:hypothetical protein
MFKSEQTGLTCRGLNEAFQLPNFICDLPGRSPGVFAKYGRFGWGRDVARDNIRSRIFRRSRRANIGAGATAMIAAADE